jgi:glycosyltransferase involved in cell wall biosynthesis
MIDKITDISCVLIVKDAQDTIKKVLKSLNIFDDIVVYLNNCTDNTEQIVKEFKNVNIIKGEFLGFGPTKNKASTFAKNNWIFSLDADEILSDEFVKNLANIKLDNKNLYSILRTNYYKNQQIKHCWGDDRLVRIYNKTQTSFTQKKVHEKIIAKNFNIVQIDGFVKHYPYSTITDFIIKLDRYSTIFAKDNKGQKKSSPTKAFFNGLFSFFKTYILKKGFLDGYAGLVIAFSHMATNFYKYIKLYEINKELKNSDE